MNFLLHARSNEICDWGFQHWKGFSPPWYITWGVDDWMLFIFGILGVLLILGLILFPIKSKGGGV